MKGHLELHNIGKMYGNTPVLESIGLTVQPGELVTLLGPSGCGKSTLLRCIAGLTDIDEGDIRLDERSIVKLPPRSREIGMVFQSYALFPNLTVQQNIEYGLKMRGADKAERRRRASELLAVIDMEEKRNAYPQELSGGQQQRVALARSLAVQPKLLLLDEPLSALDAKIRKSLRAEIRSIQQKYRMTTLFVTHDQEEALSMSDRVCVMNKGRIVQEGTPDSVYASPRTEFVARFMGHYNVLSRAETLRLFGGQAAGDSFAVRPESISVLRGGVVSAGDEVEVEAVVRASSLLGSIVRYTVEARDTRLTVDELNGKFPPLREGETVRLGLSPSQLLELQREGA